MHPAHPYQDPLASRLSYRTVAPYVLEQSVSALPSELLSTTSAVHYDIENDLFWGLTPYLGGDDKIINRWRKHVSGRMKRGSKDARDLQRLIDTPPPNATAYLTNVFKKKSNGQAMSIRSAATLLFEQAEDLPTTFETGGFGGQKGVRATELMIGSQINELEGRHGVSDFFLATHKTTKRMFSRLGGLELPTRDWVTMKEAAGCHEIDSAAVPSAVIRELHDRGDPHSMAWVRMNRRTALARRTEYLEEVERLKTLGRRYKADPSSVNGTWLFWRCLEVGGATLVQLVFGTLGQS